MGHVITLDDTSFYLLLQWLREPESDCPTTSLWLKESYLWTRTFRVTPSLTSLVTGKLRDRILRTNFTLGQGILCPHDDENPQPSGTVKHVVVAVSASDK